jgi:hypothetical protein
LPLTALALPVALVLGALSSVISGFVRRLARRERSWWADFRGLGGDVRRLLRGGKERVTVLEAGGALACFLAAGLAAAAALGEVPGSGVLLYLALLTAAAGGHLAASDPSTLLREDVVGRARVAWATAETGFLLALGAGFLRWGAGDLEAIRGAQEVLGYGPVVGPPLAAVGLMTAVALLLVAGALRMVPPSEAVRGRGRRAGGAFLIALCRWSLAGATALVGAVLSMGGVLRTAEGAFASVEDLALPGLAALGGAVVIGVVDGLAAIVPGRRILLGLGAAILAAAAVAVVVLA